MRANVEWWAKGGMFENCNCSLLCRCHISDHQPADFERCVGCFAIEIGEGRFGEVNLEGVRAFFSVDTPRQMLEGSWTAALIVDEKTNADQRKAIQSILSGDAGGTWGVLGTLIETLLPVRYAPIHMENGRKRKRMWAEGIFDTTQEPIKGADKVNDVRLENIHNQVHGSSQILALGTTTFETGSFSMITTKTHAIYSEFSWSGP